MSFLYFIPSLVQSFIFLYFSIENRELEKRKGSRNIYKKDEKSDQRPWQESNLQSPDSKSDALTIRPQGHSSMMTCKNHHSTLMFKGFSLYRLLFDLIESIYNRWLIFASMITYKKSFSCQNKNKNPQRITKTERSFSPEKNVFHSSEKNPCRNTDGNMTICMDSIITDWY